MHYSSDYVFDGEKGSEYFEEDTPSPVNKYGASKLAGEDEIRKVSDDHLIFRLSWLFGSGKQNFLYKLRQWAEKGGTVRVSGDEISVPTYVEDVVEITLAAIERGLKGLFHLTNSGKTSRFGFAEHYIEKSGLRASLEKVPMSTFVTKARRPKYSAMSNAKIVRELNVEIPSWQDAVERYIKKTGTVRDQDETRAVDIGLPAREKEKRIMGDVKTILVTGGSGFIGSNFIRYMLEQHDDLRIVNFDALTYAGNPDNLSSLEGESRYSFVKGDITDFDSVDAVMKGVDQVVHFAAESHVDRSICGPEIFTRTNVLGTQVLLDSAKENRIKRFIHVSTDEVYGSLGKDGFFTEKTKLAPNSPYSASKAASDLLARAYFKTYGFPVITTRCSNNYGPYQFPEKLIPLMITNALENKSLPIYGDGLNVRDWLYVIDHCSAIDAVRHKGRDGEIYNIGGNNECQNIDIVKNILKELDKPDSLIEFVEDRLGHDRRYAIDAAKLKNDIGWEPSVHFEEGLKNTIRWYVENNEWVERVKNGGT